METLGIAAALLTAFSWSLSSLISPFCVREIGAMAFNRWRQVFMFALLALVATGLGTWSSLSYSQAGILALSGFIGIFIGDTALFSMMGRLGPRRTQMIFSTHAPMTVVLGILFLGEEISLNRALGSLLVIVGIWIAIVYGKRKDQLHIWEQVKGALIVGVGIGMIAALGQAIGSLIAKPVMDAGADPFAAAALRVGAAGMCFSAFQVFGLTMFDAIKPPTRWVLLMTFLSGFLGLGAGMTLYMVALEYTSVGNVAVLSSTVPIMLLPLIWVVTRERPALFAFVGAIAAVAGTALIVTG